MKDYVICIDASVDIDQKYIEDNNIVIIPMKYILGETEHLMEGRDILYISLSGGLSSTCSSARTAAEEIEEDFPELEIEIVDSFAATGGMGLLLMSAVQARQDGVSLSENAKALRENALRICHWFLVDDLKYLRRGGRISAATAVAGTVLNIKPILKIADDGTLISIAKKRGLAKASSFLTECYEAAVDRSLPKNVIIAHADCASEAEAMKKRVLAATPDADVLICGLGPVARS